MATDPSHVIILAHPDPNSFNGAVAKSYCDIVEGNYQTFQLDLIKGFNKIDFEALNQGLYGPNTAQFQVYDDKSELISSNQWNLATGFKATIIIFKE